MSKTDPNGRNTREHIIHSAAELFNQQGYAGASISDIMKATGLKKGGIYNHFTSKEQLWLESFDYAYSLVSNYFTKALQTQRHAADRLQSVVDCFQQYAEQPLLSGGCPLLNTAIESDSTNPILRERVRLAFNDLTGLIQRIVERGIERKELNTLEAPEAIANVFLSTVEGGIMLSQLYGEPERMQHATRHLRSFIEQMRVPTTEASNALN